MIVAIDGPAGSGKSTTAKAVADRLGFRYLDTGAMYRAAALAFARQEVRPTPEVAESIMGGVRIDFSYEDGRTHVRLNGEDVTEKIRRPEVGAVVSAVAALPAVRHMLVAEQRRIAHEFEARGEGVVLDGRDIGTHVFPDAHVKIFMVADPRVRAERRAAELREEGIPVSHDEVLAEIVNRDAVDSSRTLAPLRMSHDAVELDTTGLSIADQVAFVVAKVRERTTKDSV